MLIIAVVCGAVPLLSKLSVSKDGSAFDFTNPIELIDRMETRAQAARAESFEQTRQQISALSMQVNELTETIVPSGDAKILGLGDAKAKTDQEPTLRDIRMSLPAPTSKVDIQKGRFGGSAVNGSRRLSATTEPSDIGKRWRRVIFTLTPTDDGTFKGRFAYFFLHDSFDPDVYRVTVKPGAKKIVFKTTAIGAFTAGVVADRGETWLEIDLSADTIDAPEDWKKR